MKRRTLIQSVLVAAPVATGSALATGTRLFGTPGSVSEAARASTISDGKLRLPLSNSGVPEQFWERIRSLADLVNGVLRSRAEAAEFSASPAAYFRKHGIDSSDPVLRDENVRLLAVIAEPDVQAALSQKDYPRFFHSLKASGALAFDSSRLQSELSIALSKNAAEVSALIAKSGSNFSGADREALLRFIEASGGELSEDDLALTYQLIASEIGNAAPSALAVVAIAFALVTAVAVGFVVVYTAIWVVGGPLETSRFANTGFGKLLEADPALSSNFERVARIAALTGDRRILQEGTRSLIATECAAIIGAMRQEKIIRINDEGADRLVEALATYSYKMVGV